MTPAPPLPMRIRFRIELAALRALSGLARLLPRAAAPVAGGGLGALAFVFSQRRRAVAFGNVERALGSEVSEGERRRIVRGAFRQFGRILVEGLMFPRYSLRDASQPGGLVRYSGLEHIRGAYESGRGVILFSAHFGNWELVALMQGFLGMPLTMVTRPLDNPHLERLLARRRSLSGNEVVHKHNSLRPMLAALSKGKGIAIVIDQNVRDGSGVFVDFLSRKASTTPALALLALRTGAAVIPVFAIPEDAGRYLFEYLPEVVAHRTGDRNTDVLALTQRCTSIIEDRIRRYPSAWLWMHERWKTRPADERRRAADQDRDAVAQARGAL